MSGAGKRTGRGRYQSAVVPRACPPRSGFEQPGQEPSPRLAQRPSRSVLIELTSYSLTRMCRTIAWQQTLQSSM